MGLSYVIVAVIAVVVTVFALQNTDTTRVSFLVWKLDAVPVAGLVLTALGAGLLVAGLPLAIRLAVWRSRARSHEKRATMLETAVAERDRQLLRQPPPGGPPDRPRPASG